MTPIERPDGETRAFLSDERYLDRTTTEGQ